MRHIDRRSSDQPQDNLDLPECRRAPHRLVALAPEHGVAAASRNITFVARVRRIGPCRSNQPQTTTSICRNVGARRIASSRSRRDTK
ncbi:hypothetical protein [Burkholderia sp. ABCPW 14]|uniref:hypothetical protein n=1 Tax=Burkholderia sp. ABCPW 14 TaxID=1637860 RepID=UPI0012E3D62C|nr:hypothetical protein [Burkholderia sp. ABCPW 14]